MLRMLVVRELWSLWLSRKMDINFDRKIISNTNRQYLVQDFLETRVSFQTNKPNTKSSFKAKRKTSQMRL